MFQDNVKPHLMHSVLAKICVNTDRVLKQIFKSNTKHLVNKIAAICFLQEHHLFWY